MDRYLNLPAAAKTKGARSTMRQVLGDARCRQRDRCLGKVTAPGMVVLLSGGVIVGGLLLVAGTVAAAVAYGKRKAWRRRAAHYCVVCYMQAQPLRRRDKTLYCPFCGADDPARIKY